MSHLPSTIAGLADDLPFVSLDPYERRWVQLTWRAILIVALVAGVYAITLHTGNGWLWQDDTRIVNDLRLRTPAGLRAIWADPFGSVAHAPPLTETLWWLEQAALPHPSPLAARCAGIVLHGWACVALWLSLRRLNVTAAWLVAAAVALHPALLAHVAWASRQQSALGGALSMTAWLALLRARHVEPAVEVPADLRAAPLPDELVDLRWLSWMAFGICSVATPLADPISALVLAVLIPSTLRIARVEVGRTLWASAIALVVVALTAACCFATHRAADADAMMTVQPIGWSAPGRFVEAIVAVPASVMQAIVPLPVRWVSDRAHWTLISMAVAVALGIVVGGVIVFAARRWLRRPEATGIVGAIVLACWVGQASTALVPSPATAVTDLIVPPVVAAVLVLAMGSVLATIDRHDAARRWALGVVVLGTLGTLTFVRAFAFAEQDAFWRSAVAHAPRSLTAHEHYAAYLSAHGRTDDAVAQLEAVPEGERDSAWMLARGHAAEAQGDVDEAFAQYIAAYQAAPDQPETTIALAEAQRNVGRPSAAITLYETYRAKHPADATIADRAGLAYAFAGHADEAIAAYRDAIRLNPSFIDAHLHLASALFNAGDYAASSAELKEAARIDPNSFATYMTSGAMLFDLRDFRSAEQMFRYAAMLDPQAADAFDKLGVALAAQGPSKITEAVWCFTRAAKLAPGDAAVAERLAMAQRQAATMAATQPSRAR